LKGFQKDIKFQWLPFHCDVAGNEKADYLIKKGTKISETSACKLTFHFAKLRIKSIKVDLSEYATQSQYKSWDKVFKNRNIIPNFLRGDAVATFWLITGHGYLGAHLHRLSIYPSRVCALCREDDSIMNKDYPSKCTILNTEVTSSILKLYWDAKR
jgi:hypothetical protein